MIRHAQSISTSGFDLFGASDKGRKRSNNEDRCGRADHWLAEGPDRSEPDLQGFRALYEYQIQQYPRDVRDLRRTYGWLAIVADGVGGNANGERASRMVVDGVMLYFYLDPEDAAPPDPVERLQYAIQRTSRAIAEQARNDNSNMASTIVAALVHDDKLTVANVGDSPAYLFQHGRPPKKLSVDHIRKGRDGSQSLAQAMGDTELSASMFTSPFQAGDVVVLCSDGLTDLVKPEEIGRIVARDSAKAATSDLIARANALGGHDNITALVVRHGRLPLLARKRFRYWLATIPVLLLLLGLLGVGVNWAFNQGNNPIVTGRSTAAAIQIDQSQASTAGPTATLDPNLPTPTRLPSTIAPVLSAPTALTPINTRQTAAQPTPDISAPAVLSSTDLISDTSTITSAAVLEPIPTADTRPKMPSFGKDNYEDYMDKLVREYGIDRSNIKLIKYKQSNREYEWHQVISTDPSPGQPIEPGQKIMIEFYEREKDNNSNNNGGNAGEGEDNCGPGKCN